MLYAVYVLYAALTGAAIVLRSRLFSRSEGARTWRVTAAAMVLAPPAIAAASMTLLVSGDVDPLLVLSLSGPGAAMLLVGIAMRFGSAPLVALALRLTGWSLIGGLTLIPAGIALFAPLSGLLAFFVPERAGPEPLEDAPP